MAKEDGESMRAAFESYQVTDSGQKNIYTLTEDPTSKKVKEAMRSLKNRLNDNQDKKFLVIYVIVGQGLQNHGQ